MKRRVVLIACLLGIIGGGAGAALAAPTTSNHDVCVVFANNGNYGNGHYICIDTP